MDKKVISREYVSTTRCDLMEDGYWKATNDVHDRVLYEGEEWVDEMIEAMSMDTDPKEAIKTAMQSSLNYLIQNVYQNGFEGLVEYREYERNMKALKNPVKEETNVEAESAANS